jgi:hypothetical protein
LTAVSIISVSLLLLSITLVYIIHHATDHLVQFRHSADRGVAPHLPALPAHPGTTSGRTNPVTQSLETLPLVTDATSSGEVIARLTTRSTTAYSSWVSRWFGVGSHRTSPSAALGDGAGSCWLIPGKVGQLGVRLPNILRITHVAVEHAVQQQVSAAELAPRKMVLWGLVDGKENLAKFKYLRNSATGMLRELFTSRTGPGINEHLPFVPLASFDYNIHSDNHIQTFPVFDSVANAGMDFGVVVLEILDNWGGRSTCLYRFRVHAEV